MNIFVLNTLEAGIVLLERLRAKGLVSGIIGLNERPASDSISGYRYMGPYCGEHGIRFLEVADYRLASAADRELLEGTDIDVLIVSGWQRLIPQWLIDRCRVCAIGTHGSPNGICGGRGRSPQNWAMIFGSRKFSVSIFKIAPGIDDGEIIDTTEFTYTDRDDIGSSYLKVSLCAADMILNAVESGKIFLKGTEQNHENARHLPQRLPEDGAIDWRRGAGEIDRFVRALSRPYPGAFSWLPSGEKITFWRVRPFELPEQPLAGQKPGEIVLTLPDSELLISTGHGWILAEDYSLDPGGAGAIATGTVMLSADFDEQMRNIVRRHYGKWPDLRLVADFDRFTSIHGAAGDGWEG